MSEPTKEEIKTPTLPGVDVLMAQAAGILRAIGFEFNCSSMMTEATYYNWPGRTEVIRIASHGRHKKRTAHRRTGTTTIAYITFPLDKLVRAHLIEKFFEERVACGIGKYFMRLAERGRPILPLDKIRSKT